MHPRRRVRAAALTAATAVLSATLAAVAATPGLAATPKTPRFSTTIENLSPYQPQTKCHPTAQKGVLEFRALILATYAGTGDDGIVRACSSGGRSEHKEGRAWDWMVSVNNPHQVAQVHALFTWLFASDGYGHKYAMARRLGIMYIIWNKRIWGSYAASSGWRPYSCTGVTGCHQNHVHFSFSRAGAQGITSYWTKVVVNVGGVPGNGTPAPVKNPPVTNPPVQKPPVQNPGRGENDGDGSTWHPPTPPAQLKLPYTVEVPTDGEVLTPAPLLAGRHYRITATGSYEFGAVQTSWDDDNEVPLRADAECAQQPTWDHNGVFSAGWTTSPQFSRRSSDSLLDLAAGWNHQWTPTVDDGNGCNSTDHTYVMSVTPDRTAPLFLRVVGGDRMPETGTLEVTITADRG
jgi:hypothetical protein